MGVARIIAVSLAACLAWPPFAQAQQTDPDKWPKLAGDADGAICSQALQLGRTVFKSDSFFLYGPPAIAANFESDLLAAPNSQDISGGSGVQFNQAAFDLISHRKDAGDDIFWEKDASYGQRLVLIDEAFNWQGDTYSLYALPESMQPEQFSAQLADSRSNPNPSLRPVIEGWRPPLMLRDRRTQQNWFIDYGPPYVFLGDWHIYSMTASGVANRCTISFHKNVRNAALLFPTPVSRLAQLLDQTMGSGHDEGTLHPTARLRLTVLTIAQN